MSWPNGLNACASPSSVVFQLRLPTYTLAIPGDCYDNKGTEHGKKLSNDQMINGMRVHSTAREIIKNRQQKKGSGNKGPPLQQSLTTTLSL